MTLSVAHNSVATQHAHYDLLVIGCGTAGRLAALAAARNHLVAVVDPTAGPNVLRVDADTLRRLQQAVLNGKRTMAGLRRALQQMLQDDALSLRDEFNRLGVDLYSGDVCFTGPHAVEVRGPHRFMVLSAERIVLACGATTVRPAAVPVEGKRVLDAGDVWELESLPRSMLVVGGGELGAEYARLFAALGVNAMQTPHWSLVRDPDADIVLYLGREVADTAGLNLAAAGLAVDEHGRVWCDGEQRTWAPHISAVGDVVGFTASGRAFQMCG